jgi:hypothetical protein
MYRFYFCCKDYTIKILAFLFGMPAVMLGFGLILAGHDNPAVPDNPDGGGGDRVPLSLRSDILRCMSLRMMEVVCEWDRGSIDLDNIRRKITLTVKGYNIEIGSATCKIEWNTLITFDADTSALTAGTYYKKAATPALALIPTPAASPRNLSPAPRMLRRWRS